MYCNIYGLRISLRIWTRSTVIGTSKGIGLGLYENRKWFNLGTKIRIAQKGLVYICYRSHNNYYYSQ
jgi:hypothetical protein